jgi:hypothetical protein
MIANQLDDVKQTDPEKITVLLKADPESWHQGYFPVVCHPAGRSSPRIHICWDVNRQRFVPGNELARLTPSLGRGASRVIRKRIVPLIKILQAAFPGEVQF